MEFDIYIQLSTHFTLNETIPKVVNTFIDTNDKFKNCIDKKVLLFNVYTFSFQVTYNFNFW